MNWVLNNIDYHDEGNEELSPYCENCDNTCEEDSFCNCCEIVRLNELNKKLETELAQFVECDKGFYCVGVDMKVYHRACEGNE